jgi:hypothetical protein
VVRARNDQEIVAARQLFARLDNIAIRLDDAINPAIDATLGEGDRTAAQARLRRVLTDLEQTVGESPGKTTLIDTARGAIADLDGDETHALTQLHDKVFDARDQLAAAVMGR